MCLSHYKESNEYSHAPAKQYAAAKGEKKVEC